MRIICENCEVGIHVAPNSEGEKCWKCGKFVKVKKLKVLPDLKDI